MAPPDTTIDAAASMSEPHGERGTDATRRWRVAGIVLLLLAALAAPRLLAERPFELRMVTVVCLYAVLGHGWNVIGGYAGQTSLGHGVFFGVGAYVTALAGSALGWNPWAGMALGALVAAAIGVAIGWPCFRLRGHYFVIATLVLAESAYLLVTAWEPLGGAMGLSLPIAPDGYANLQFARDKTGYYYIALGMLVATTVLVGWLQRAPFGYVLRAIRDDESATRSLGHSPARYKQAAMAISAAIVAVGGGFFAQYVLFVDPPSVLALSMSITIALIPILGGIGTVSGPIIGAAVLVPLSEYSRVWFSGSGRNVDLLIYGALIMLISVYRPQGLAGMLARRPGRR